MDVNDIISVIFACAILVVIFIILHKNKNKIDIKKIYDDPEFIEEFEIEEKEQKS